MVALFRAMKDDGDGRPVCAPNARSLGVRVGVDVDLGMEEDDMVEPGSGGMSVAPFSPQNLEEHRRPVALGGSSRDPLWTIDDEDLPSELVYRADPEDPSSHGFIEPIRLMRLDEYQEALASSRGTWVRVEGEQP